jgi:hypothetical protein
MEETLSEDIAYSGEITLEFTCGECGQAVDTNQTKGRWDDITINVDPCTTCVEKAREEGREEER